MVDSSTSSFPDIVAIQSSTPSSLMNQSCKYVLPLLRMILSSPNSETSILMPQLQQLIENYATPTETEMRSCWPFTVIRDPDPLACRTNYKKHTVSCKCWAKPYYERDTCDHPGFDRHRHPCWRKNNNNNNNTNDNNNNNNNNISHVESEPCICPVRWRRELEIPKCKTCKKSMELLYELPSSSLPVFISESFWNTTSSSSSSRTSSSSLFVWLCGSDHTRKKRRFNDSCENSQFGCEILQLGRDGQKHRTLNYSRFKVTAITTQEQKQEQEQEGHQLNANANATQATHNPHSAVESDTTATASSKITTSTSTSTSTSSDGNRSTMTTNNPSLYSSSHPNVRGRSCPCWCPICSASSCHQRIVMQQPHADIPQVQYDSDVPQLRMDNQLFRDWYRDNCSDAEGQRKFMPIKGDKLGGFPWFWHCQFGWRCAIDEGCDGPATFIMQVAGDSPLLEPLSDLFQHAGRGPPYGAYLYRCEQHPQHFTFEVHWSSLSSDDPFCNCGCDSWEEW